MRIAASNVSLTSEQTNIKISSQYTSLRKWDKNSETIENSHHENEKLLSHTQKTFDRIEIDAEILKQNQEINNCSINKNEDKTDDQLDICFSEMKLLVFKNLVEMFTGTKIKVYQPEEQTDIIENAEIETAESAPSSSDSPELKGWGIDYTYKESHYTKEGFSIEASGSVVTESGNSISFNTSLSMNRETYNELTVSIKAGDALIDPLVINFGSRGAQLSNNKFKFDLNIDGIIDSIAAPAQGTGFLAYDKNGDGIINDGSELFGPTSGNGFSELSQFDDDHNGWIDENDAIFSKLRIWEKDSDNIDLISPLLDRNVGAIYTGRVDTSFDMLDNNNTLSGRIKQSGIWLNEKSGIAGSIQEIDLVV